MKMVPPISQNPFVFRPTVASPTAYSPNPVVPAAAGGGVMQAAVKAIYVRANVLPAYHWAAGAKGHAPAIAATEVKSEFIGPRSCANDSH